jgi:hypothetical protein
VGGEGGQEAIARGHPRQVEGQGFGEEPHVLESGTVSRVGLRTKTWPFRDATRAISATAWPGRR